MELAPEEGLHALVRHDALGHATTKENQWHEAKESKWYNPRVVH
jgi:hypothetical protein